MPIKAAFTGDVSDLQRSTRAARDEFQKVGTEAGKTSRSLRAVGSSFDGTKIEGAALRAAQGVEKIGGVTRLTSAELTKLSRTVDEATSKLAKMGGTASPTLQKLSADIKQAQKSTEGYGTATAAADQVLGRFGITVSQGLGIAAVGAVGALAAGVTAALTKTIQYGGAISDVAVKAGVSAEALQELTFAAAQAGNTQEQVTTSLQRMSRNIVEGSKQTQAAVAGIGLSLTDLQAMQPDAAFQAIAKGIAAMPDPMQRATAAMQLFGKAGADILPLLASNIEDIRQQARDLGIVMSNEAVAAADDLADTWDRLTAAGEGLLRNVVTPLIGPLRELARLLEAVQIASIGSSVRFGVSVATERAQAALASVPGLRYTPFGMSATMNLQNIQSQVGAGGQDFVNVMRGVGRAAGSSGPAVGSGTGTIPDAAKIAAAAAAARAAESAIKKAAAEAKKWADEVDKLTGADTIRSAERLAKQIKEAGAQQLDPKGIPAVVDTLRAAEQRAAALGLAISSEVGGAFNALVRTPAYQKFFADMQKRPELFDTLAAGKAVMGGALSGSDLDRRVNPFPSRLTPQIGVNQFDPGFQQTGITGAIAIDLQRGIPAAKNFRVELQGVAQAFAQMAQAAGPALDGVTRSAGILLTSANAAEELARALKLVDTKGELSRGGQAAAGGFAGLTTGLALGSLTSNRAAGGLFGGVGGGAAGYLATGTGVGLGVGLAVGALAGIYGAYQNQKAQRAQMDQLRQDAITAAGGLEQLQAQAVRAGFSVEEFMRRFGSSDPKVFTGAINDMNLALAEQARRATELGKALGSVTRQQGVLSQQQIAQIRTADSGGPAAQAIVDFAQEQKQSTMAGILRAAAALQQAMSLTDAELAALTEGITDSEERQARIESALRDKSGAIMSTLGPAVQGTASAIFVSIQDALDSGERLVDVLADLAPAIVTVRDLFARAGQTPGAGFQQIQSYQDIASGPQTGPALELAGGLGQALAGFANTGLLSPELFKDMANGIGSAYKQMELLGKGGLDAARLMQPALQTIWQLIEDNPGLEDQLDDDTRALLDFATQSGLVGDKFRPAVDRMIDALNDLIGKFDEFLGRMAAAQGLTLPTVPGVPPSSGTPGALGGGGGGTDSQGGGSGGDYTGLASGGIVTRPTMALIGEGGEPEAVIPLSRWASMAGTQQQTIYVNVGREVIARAAAHGLPREIRMVAR